MVRAMERDAEATRRRLLDAAAAEFARHGIAGARVDRIAAAARANKAQIYHYFGSKDDLFDAVFESFVEASVASDYFDPADLGETAGRLFDQFQAAPELGRLTSWYRLERAGSAPSIAPVVTANARKVAAIRAAQQAGIVAEDIPADVLLGLVITIATAWTSLPPEFEQLVAGRAPGERRAAVVDAVRRLVAPGR